MEHLVTLRLEGNRLEALPAEIGFLSSLKWLYLRGNRLAALPSTLGFLSELRGLNVSENALTSFPPTLGKLSKVRRGEDRSWSEKGGRGGGDRNYFICIRGTWLSYREV